MPSATPGQAGIVASANCIRQMRDGGAATTRATVGGAMAIWRPVTASVLTTIVVFLPLMFMSGIFGKFVKEIPLGVIIALLISLMEAFFVLPAHVAALFKDPKASHSTTKIAGRFSHFWSTVV